MENEDRLNVNISAPNLISLCVDTSDRGEFSGRLYQCYDEKPWSFANVVHLLHLMDELYDRISYPQAATEIRTFIKKEKVPAKKLEKKISPEEILGQKGKVATFVIYVQYRQNATWQGDVVWVEHKAKQHFRSALELIKLIDSVLAEYNMEQ